MKKSIAVLLLCVLSVAICHCQEDAYYYRTGGKVFLNVDTMHTVLAIDYYATQETIELINKKIDSISSTPFQKGTAEAAKKFFLSFSE